MTGSVKRCMCTVRIRLRVCRYQFCTMTIYPLPASYLAFSRIVDLSLHIMPLISIHINLSVHSQRSRHSQRQPVCSSRGWAEWKSFARIVPIAVVVDRRTVRRTYGLITTCAAPLLSTRSNAAQCLSRRICAEL